jgi:hypothetical protein
MNGVMHVGLKRGRWLRDERRPASHALSRDGEESRQQPRQEQEDHDGCGFRADEGAASGHLLLLSHSTSSVNARAAEDARFYCQRNPSLFSRACNRGFRPSSCMYQRAFRSAA